MNYLFLTVAVVAAVVELRLTFSLFFSDWEAYGEAWRYQFTPDAWSWFKGEYIDDKCAEWNLRIYHAGGVVTGIGVYWGLGKLVSWISG